ncbi:UNVERIFIED_CONTAM: hypothetical protein Sradi_0743700 [Sesamum radiatum]|uniref:Uncharacterized protein n=1 Tax=Sesamum radiatum TaxID=300843 RepID=A0AAW2VSU9_SESRA
MKRHPPLGIHIGRLVTRHPSRGPTAQALQIAEGTSLSLASRVAPLVGGWSQDPPRPTDPLTKSPHTAPPRGGSPRTPIHQITDGHHSRTGANSDIIPSPHSNSIERGCPK